MRSPALASLGLGVVLGPEAPLIALGAGSAVWTLQRARRDIPAHVATTVALFTLYAIVPAAGESGARALVELIIGLALFGAILLWLALSITNANFPELRAVEAMAVSVVVLITVFAFTYLSLARENPGSFSEPLDHISAIYFTTLGTVGYGDIAAKTEAAPHPRLDPRSCST